MNDLGSVAGVQMRWCLTVASLALLLAGCCHRRIDPPAELIEDPVELLNRVEARLAELQSARLRAVSEYYGGDLRGANFRQAVLVRQPEDIHVQILSPFGQSLQTMVSNGERLSLYDLEAEVYYSGAPTPENLARLLPFYMTAADIVRVFLGAPPLDLLADDPADDTLEWDGEVGAYRLRAPLARGGGHLEIWIRHEDWIMVGAKQFGPDGELVFELRTGDLETFGDWRLPTRLRFLMQDPEEVDMSIELESAELNPALPDALFVLEPPRGVEQISLD